MQEDVEVKESKDKNDKVPEIVRLLCPIAMNPFVSV